jgi:hypothetical protein
MDFVRNPCFLGDLEPTFGWQISNRVIEQVQYTKTVKLFLKNTIYEEYYKNNEEPRRMAGYGGTILAVQDTTGVNYNTHLKTEGIGYISDKTMGGQCP